MGRILAEKLEGDLDVVLVRKLSAPDQEELAIGAVDESGEVYLHPYARRLGVSEDYLAQEKEKQLKLIQSRRLSYTPGRTPSDPRGRTVIVVDDGVATGATMISALHAIRAKRPGKLIVAIGVAPPETLVRLREAADEVVCLYAPEEFYAVGQFFEDFSQVTDQEVLSILREKARRPAPAPREK
jgi:putative phosphoribosyl transferase